MTEIRPYSSIFSTKINYILDITNTTPIQHGRIKAIEYITQEKESTINNWLFNGKIPRENKKLSIADAVGVSHKYLFDDKIEIEDVKKPEIFIGDNIFLVPFIQESEIFSLHEQNIFKIEKRQPIMFPGFDKLVSKFGNQIYVTHLENKNFGAHIEKNSGVIYSENVIFEDFCLVIHQKKGTSNFSIKRVILDGENGFIEHFTENGEIRRSSLNHEDDFLSIILTYSK